MVYLVFLLGFFILFSVIVWRDFVMGMSLFVLLLPAYVIRFDVGPLPSTALEGMAVILFLIWLVKRVKEKTLFGRFHRLLHSTFFLSGLFLVIASALSILWTTDMRAAAGIWKAYFLEPFFVYLIFVDVLERKENWKPIIVAFGLTTIALTLLAITQRITGWWSPTWEWTQPGMRRVTGVFTSPNSLGLYVAPVVMLALGRIVSLKDKDWMNYVFVGSGVLAIALAVSRGAMIGLAAAITFLLFFAWSKKKTVFGVVVLSIILLFTPATQSKILSLATFQEASGQSRLNLYSGSFEMIKANPIKGAGLASFFDGFELVRPAEYTEELIYPHNIFLNFWVETGLLGLVVVLFIMGEMVWLYWQSKPEDRVWQIVFLGAFVTMLVHGLVDVPYFKNDLAMMTWILLAGLAKTIRVEQKCYLHKH